MSMIYNLGINIKQFNFMRWNKNIYWVIILKFMVIFFVNFKFVIIFSIIYLKFFFKGNINYLKYLRVILRID